MEKCSRRLLALVGERHPTYFGCLFIMGETFVELGKMKKAHELMEKSCKLVQLTSGANSTKYVYALSNLARLVFRIGDYQQAS